MLRSTKVAVVHHATGQQRRQERVVMVIRIPRGCIFPPSFSPQVCIMSTCCNFFLSRCFSLHLSVFVFPSLFSLCLSHSALFLFLCLNDVSCRLFPLSHNVFFCSHLSTYFFFSLFFFVSLWSSPLVQPLREGETEEGKEC